jgi:hypothetical protein
MTPGRFLCGGRTRLGGYEALRMTTNTKDGGTTNKRNGWIGLRLSLPIPILYGDSPPTHKLTTVPVLFVRAVLFRFRAWSKLITTLLTALADDRMSDHLVSANSFSSLSRASDTISRTPAGRMGKAWSAEPSVTKVGNLMLSISLLPTLA